MANGVGTDGAEVVGIQYFKRFGIDSQLFAWVATLTLLHLGITQTSLALLSAFAAVPPHGEAVVDEAGGDIDGEGDIEAFQQGIGDVVVVLVAVVESETDIFFS